MVLTKQRFALVLAFLCISVSALASVPPMISYQGKLTQRSDVGKRGQQSPPTDLMQCCYSIVPTLSREARSR